MLADLSRPLMRRAVNHLLRFGAESKVPGPLPEPGKRYLLYVHIPFCTHLCPYCSFHRVSYDEDLSRRYFHALRREIEAYHDLGFKFEDVYVGGGTPTVNLPELALTLKLIRERFPIKTISVETNPDHLDTETTSVLNACDVSRLSVGVQSFDDDQLHRMGRLEAYGSSRQVLSRLEAVHSKFQTVNVDMIFNLPGQSMASLDLDITKLLESGVSQASFYPLMMSDTTSRTVDRQMGEYSLTQEREMYYRILDRMSPTHSPSTVWCFSRDAGQIDEYIVDYPEFIGAGSGAFSYLGGVFYANSFSILRYDELLAKQNLGITRARQLSASEQRYYQLLTRLFSRKITNQQVKAIYGNRPPRVPGLLRRTGILGNTEDGYQLTREGHYFWLIAMSEFLTGVNNLRDEMRAHIREEIVASYGDAVPITIRSHD